MNETILGRPRRHIEQEEATEWLRRSYLVMCTRKVGCGTIIVEHVAGRPTNTGRTDQFRVAVWMPVGTDPRPRRHVITGLVAEVLGYRLNRRRDALIMHGCGLSKEYHILSRLADVAGAPIHSEGDYGWVKP